MARDRTLQLMLRKGDEFDRYFERCVEREGVFDSSGASSAAAGAAPRWRRPFKWRSASSVASLR